MAIEYEVLRFGEDCDRGPNGEFGIVLIGREGDVSTGFTGHCLISHEHSKACAQTLLDESGREVLDAYFQVRAATLASRPVHTKAPLPKKAKSVEKDGAMVEEQVDDVQLT